MKVEDNFDTWKINWNNFKPKNSVMRFAVHIYHVKFGSTFGTLNNSCKYKYVNIIDKTDSL